MRHSSHGQSKGHWLRIRHATSQSGLPRAFCADVRWVPFDLFTWPRLWRKMLPPVSLSLQSLFFEHASCSRMTQHCQLTCVFSRCVDGAPARGRRLIIFAPLVYGSKSGRCLRKTLVATLASVVRGTWMGLHLTCLGRPTQQRGSSTWCKLGLDFIFSGIVICLCGD